MPSSRLLPRRGRQALFLDRDGVINVDRHYVYRIDDFEFMPGIFELCATAADLGYTLVVVTNQAGIGRGLYSEADYERLTSWMVDAFRSHGTDIAHVYHCPYHPTEGLGAYRRDSFDRKPNPGMLLRARDDLDLDLGRSILIGDKHSDMAAGARAGVGCLLHLSMDQYPAEGVDHGAIVVRTLDEARQWVRQRRLADGERTREDSPA